MAALTELAEGAGAWGLPVFALGEFIRVVTHPRVFAPPTRLDAALAFIDELLRSPSVRLLSPGPRYWRILKEVADDAGASGNLVFDAQIAAVGIEHGATTILTQDKDFRRFSGLTVRSL